LFHNKCRNSNKQINKQTNKQTNHFLLIKNVTWDFFLTFINVFDFTKTCYRLACTDNMKTCAIVPLQ
jgi:hypothetical protein